MTDCKCHYHLGMGPNLLCPVHGDLIPESERVHEPTTTEFSTIGQLKEAIKNLPDDREVVCQVVGKDGSAWQIFSKITDRLPRADFAFITLSHPELLSVNPVFIQNQVDG